MTDHFQDDFNMGIMRSLYIHEYLLLEVFHRREYPNAKPGERLVRPYAEMAVDRVNAHFRSGPVQERLLEHRNAMIETLVEGLTGEGSRERPKTIDGIIE